jgi:hypothetical protein
MEKNTESRGRSVRMLKRVAEEEKIKGAMNVRKSWKQKTTDARRII